MKKPSKKESELIDRCYEKLKFLGLPGCEVTCPNLCLGAYQSWVLCGGYTIINASGDTKEEALEALLDVLDDSVRLLSARAMIPNLPTTQKGFQINLSGLVKYDEFTRDLFNNQEGALLITVEKAKKIRDQLNVFDFEKLNGKKDDSKENTTKKDH